MYIRVDNLSLTLTVGSSIIVLYFSLYALNQGGNFNFMFFPALLAVFSMAMSAFIMKTSRDTNLTLSEMRDIAKYAFLGLLAIMGFGTVLTQFLIPQSVALSTQDLLMYQTAIAINEEMLFRGFFANFAWMFTKSHLATSIASTVIFTVVHLPVYESNTMAMAYVIFSGFVLTGIALVSRRVSPGMLAHLSNNILASGVLGVVARG
jgi:membrane protease YdiL (CAAX protease family)